MSRAAGWRWHASLAIMLGSGFAGLGYQVIWTQQCAVWLGHESASLLAVVAAFFGGIAVGAIATGRRIESSARPVHWYAACEVIVAVWCLVLIPAMPPFGAWALQLIGPQPSPGWQWTVAFAGTFVLLLPATAAMGATLPAIERVAMHRSRDRRSVAAHYAANTFGAVLGVLAIVFWLVPTFGLSRTTAICSAINLLCAAVALAVFPSTADVAAAAAAPTSAIVRWPALARLACTGLLGIGYEILVVRVLSQVAENTIYTFALLLAVYLGGTAAGASAYHRWLSRRGEAARTGDALLIALAMACLAGTGTLWAAEWVKAEWLGVFGESFAVAVGAEAVIAVLAFALPTIVMGALFSHLSQRANAAGIGFGAVLGANTLGAAVAPVLVGVVLAPLLGAKLSLLAVSVGYAAMVAGTPGLGWLAALPIGAAVSAAILAPALAFVDVPDGGHVVSYEEGAMAAVSVVADADGVLRLRINNRQQEGSSSSQLIDGRQALLPLLLHPAPRRALFLGLGTGVTASTAARTRDLEVDAVELLPEVIAASAHFGLSMERSDPPPRLHVVAADARRYVRASAQHYDVIVSDNFHPARSGSGALYTVEHFQAVRARLNDGGVFCQWLPLHQLDLGTMRSIVRSFLTVFPDGSALLANNSLTTPVVGLVARLGDSRFDAAAMHSRLNDDEFMPIAGSAFAPDDGLAVLGSFIAGARGLDRFAADSPANTDDRPIVSHRAPRITYAPDSMPGQRLAALLRQVSVSPGELLGDLETPAFKNRLSAYWAARDQFIRVGLAVRPTADVRQMLAQVREPLLVVLRTSPDFRPAYDPLLRMATALAATDPSAARSLMADLARRQPPSEEIRPAPSTVSGTAP